MIKIVFTDRRTGQTKELVNSYSWDVENDPFQWGENSLSDDARRADMMYKDDPTMAIGATFGLENLITVVITDDHDTEVYRDPVFPELSKFEALRRSASTLVDMSQNCGRGDYAERMLPSAEWVRAQLAAQPESAHDGIVQVLDDLIAALKAQKDDRMSPALDAALQALCDHVHP